MGQQLFEAAATRAADVTDTTVNAIEARLDELTELSSQLTPTDGYEMPPRDYEVPAEFKLSVVIPVFNEEATIREVVARVLTLPFRKEVIVVDDCSTDGTRGVLSELLSVRELLVIFKSKNAGKGAALRTGFAAARGDVVVVQDADLEYDPRDLIGVIRPLVEGRADAVFGSRFIHERPQDPSWLHRFGNGLLTWSSNVCTGLRITDMETCYKAFRRELLQSIPLKQNRFGFEPEITAKLARRRARVCEVPITYRARGYAEGKKIGLKDAFNAFFCIARYSLAD